MDYRDITILLIKIVGATMLCLGVYQLSWILPYFQNDFLDEFLDRVMYIASGPMVIIAFGGWFFLFPKKVSNRIYLE